MISQKIKSFCAFSLLISHSQDSHLPCYLQNIMSFDGIRLDPHLLSLKILQKLVCCYFGVDCFYYWETIHFITSLSRVPAICLTVNYLVLVSFHVFSINESNHEICLLWESRYLANQFNFVWDCFAQNIFASSTAALITSLTYRCF